MREGKLYVWIYIFMLTLTSCKTIDNINVDIKRTEIIYLHEDGHKIIAPDTQLEILGSGFSWTEGPLYLESLDRLLFTDIPNNKIFSWDAKNGVQLYLEPSGHTGILDRVSTPGANGLLLNHKNQLILCQQGDRRIAIMNASLKYPKADFTTVVDAYNNQRLNSPNDAVVTSNNILFFTDPPYGLDKEVGDPNQELSFYGVYKLTSTNKLVLLTKDLERPNGIALSNDEKRLFVANSDKNHPVWMVYDIDEDGNVLASSIFYDASEEAKIYKGNPDGMVYSKKRDLLYATGPGGVWVFDKEGTPLVRVLTGALTSNCTLSTKEDYLYITAHTEVLRIKLVE